ncbi:MAG: hypothetical protein FJX77_05715, partial [Armatimonadetes bacterium]|nr:hypothetical protein [Armatimonadota bacterium]
EAEAAGRLANACDDPEHCRFVFASRIERGPLTISVFTHGAAPVLSRRVRRDLEGWLGPEYAELAHLVAEVRTLLKQAPGLSQPARQRILERIVYGEALHLLREGQPEEARARIGEILREMAPGVA